MHKESKKLVSLINVVLLAIMMYMIPVIIIGCIKNHNKGIVVEDIVSKWECSVDGEKLDKKVSLNHKFRDLKVGSNIIFTKKSKELKGIKYPALLCNFMFCSAKVYYDDKLVYKHSYSKGIIDCKEATIQIENYKKDKEIKIELSIIDPESKVYMGEAKLVEEVEEKGYCLRKNMYSLVLGGLMCIFGIIVMVIITVIQLKNDDFRQLFWLSVFFINFAIILLAKNNLFMYIYGEPIVTEIALILATLISLISIMIIHLYMYKDNKIKKMFKILCVTLITLSSIILLIGYILGEYVNAAVIAGIIMLILIIGLIVLLINDIKNVDGLNRFFYIGMFIIYGIIVSILATLVFFEYIHFINVFKAGIMLIGTVLLLFVMIDYSFKIKDYMDNLAEDKVLEVLAYTDHLTGIMNRTKYEEELKHIRNEKYSTCVFISFDLNSLKAVNDLYGHEVGDVYIKSFAKCLRIGFGDEGFIARIGGDEFIAIVKNKGVNIENIIEQMQLLLKTTMKNYKDVEVSFAYGSAISNKGSIKSIDELIELADSNMYENKKKIKNQQTK